jgi:hypothetical protein
MKVRTRLWQGEFSSTAVQFRTDSTPMVWIHTNFGWVPAGNAPEDDNEAEKFAQDIADGYKLQESSQEMALYFLGEEEA